MLDLLWTEVKFDATSPPVIIENVEFFRTLSSAYEQRNTNYEAGRRFKHLRHIGITLRNGTYKQLAYLMNVKNSHWMAIVLDFDESYILYGDSLGGKPDDHLKNVSSWWAHLHTGRNFVWGKLDITVQQDGFCKGNLTNLRRELHLSLAKGNPKRTL
jgi:hypothetical protein